MDRQVARLKILEILAPRISAAVTLVSEAELLEAYVFKADSSEAVQTVKDEKGAVKKRP